MRKFLIALVLVILGMTAQAKAGCEYVTIATGSRLYGHYFCQTSFTQEFCEGFPVDDGWWHEECYDLDLEIGKVKGWASPAVKFARDAA